MGELLLCHETIAALPYYIEETGINIYSMEELSYYIPEMCIFWIIPLCVRVYVHGWKTDASCRTRTKTQGEYPHGRKIVRFYFAILQDTAYCTMKEMQEIVLRSGRWNRSRILSVTRSGQTS